MRRNFKRRSSSVGSKSESTTTMAMGVVGLSSDEKVSLDKIKFDEKTTTTTATAEDLEIAKQLFSSLLYMKDSSGRMYLHTDFKLSWAKALLDRAKNLDDGAEHHFADVVGTRRISSGARQRQHQQKNSRNRKGSHHHNESTTSFTSTRNNNNNNNNNPTSSTTLMQRRFLLQPDQESGYNPFHRAIVEGNLAAVLLFLRHAMDTTSTERLTQRPMTVLHAAEANNSNQNKHSTNNQNNNNNNNNNNTLLLAMASATDHEGMTPLRLLGQLQQSELLRCRKYLSYFQPAVDRNATIRLRSRQRRSSFDDGGGGNNNNDDDTGIDFFSANADLLQIDRDSDDDDNDNEYTDQSVSYACEVVTFGRPHHCALGVVQGGSSFSSSSSSTFCPQRVQDFAQECVGRDNSAMAVAAATYHTLVVTKKGELYSFGVENCGGRLGLGDQQTQQCPLPKRVLGALQRRKVVSVAAAENHSLCVTSLGGVYSWGSNRFGQLGDVSGNASAIQCGSRSLPRRVEDLKQHPCVAVAAGEKHSVALSRKGEVYVWGDNASGQLGVSRRSGIQKVQRVEALWASSTTQSNSPKIAIAIAAAEQSTLVLTTGSPSSGLSHVNTIYEFGHGNHVPVRVHFDVTKASNNGNQSSSFSSRFNRIANPTAIACARYHNAAITSDGLVYTWGLRAESLGRGNNNKSLKQPQRRNSLPQLVTGMLPERGGGLAVAIAASGSHTAVVCNNGALFTWGTTDEKNVLGHDGCRWCPNPKRVPGVHRAVDVAVAKEHTILLIGASFPAIPKNDTLLSLEVSAARKVAEYVDLFNVIPILIMAERTESPFLISHCTDFIRRNFDGVLNVGKKIDMNQYLNDMLAETTYRGGKRFRDDHHHPFIFDVLTAGNIGRPTFDREWFSSIEDWVEGCKRLSESPIIQRLLALASVREYEEDVGGLKSKARRGSSCQKEFHELNQRKRSITTGQEAIAKEGDIDRCIKKTANMDLSTIERVNENSVWLSKEIRAVRKKLKQICNLFDAETRQVSLSAEQKAKVDRRPALETELSIYESAVEEVEKRIKELIDENQENKKRLSTSKSEHPLHQEKINIQNETIDKDEGDHNSELLGKRNKDNEISESSKSTKKDDKTYLCDLCGVKCSDKENFFLHQNGRKHRNRATQLSEEEKERAAASIRQQQQIEQMKAVPVFTPPSKNIIKNVWGAPSSQPQPHYKLPPPPHPVVEHVALKTSSSPKISPISPSANFKEILKDEESAKMIKKNLSRTTKQSSRVLPGNNMISSIVSPSPSRNITSSPGSIFAQILKEQEIAKKKKKKSSSVATKRPTEPIVWASSPGSTRCVPLAMYATPDQKAQNSQRSTSVSLADFLTPSRDKQISFLSSSPNTAPWLKDEPAANKVEKTTTTMMATPNSKSIVQIQAEEADLKARQDKSYGKEGGGSWYVNRRERAESVLEIQKSAQEDLEHRLLVEEQMKIEAQIHEDNNRKQKQHGKQQQEKKGGSSSSSNNNSSNKGGVSKRRNSKAQNNSNNKDNTTVPKTAGGGSKASSGSKMNPNNDRSRLSKRSQQKTKEGTKL